MSISRTANAAFPRPKASAASPFFSRSRIMTMAGLFGIGITIAGLISVFLPSRDERLISAAQNEVLSRLAIPASAVFAEVTVEEERIRSWTTSAVQGCVKSRQSAGQFPTWQGFSVEGNDVSFKNLYCPYLP
jgi:hypothetical protein